MQLTTALLSLTTLLPAILAQDLVKNFPGTGQLRTLHNVGDHEDLGCLTASGQWTVDEPLCGLFVTEQINNGSFYLSPVNGGSCGIDGATFRCNGQVQRGVFGTWGTPGLVAGWEVLRYGQYGTFATNAPDSPPLPGAAPLDIHFYSGSERGKWALLGWKRVE